MEQKKLSLVNKLCYSLGEAGEAFSWTYVSMYLMYFWTDVLGLHMASTGVILLLSRLWDGVSDACIGYWIDKTQTRMGKFRPWILASCVPIAITNILCFSVLPIQSQTGKQLYAIVTFMLLIFAYSCENVAQNAMPVAMTTDALERTNLASWRTFAGYMGSIIVSYLSLRCVDWFGGGDEQKGFFLTTILYGIIIVILFLLCVKGTREVVRTSKNASKIRIKDTLKAFQGNTPAIVLIGAFTLIGFFHYGRSAVAVYYFTYIGGDKMLHSVWSIVQMSGSILGSLMVPFLTRRLKNKRSAVMIGWGTGGILMILLSLFSPQKQHSLFFVIQFFIGAGIGMATTGIYGMIPDITEYTENMHGMRIAGSLSAVISFFNKCGMAFGTSTAAWLLSALGYVANQQQTPEVLTGIHMMFTVLPGVLALLSVLILRFYKLDRKMHQELVEKLYTNKQ